MTLLALFGVGVLLGMRFRVLVLIPAIACAVVIQVVVAVVTGQHSFGSVTALAAATVAILQIGYWVGLAGRYLSALSGRAAPATCRSLVHGQLLTGRTKLPSR